MFFEKFITEMVRGATTREGVPRSRNRPLWTRRSELVLVCLSLRPICKHSMAGAGNASLTATARSLPASFHCCILKNLLPLTKIGKRGRGFHDQILVRGSATRSHDKTRRNFLNSIFKFAFPGFSYMFFVFPRPAAPGREPVQNATCDKFLVVTSSQVAFCSRPQVGGQK